MRSHFGVVAAFGGRALWVQVPSGADSKIGVPLGKLQHAQVCLECMSDACMCSEHRTHEQALVMPSSLHGLLVQKAGRCSWIASRPHSNMLIDPWVRVGMHDVGRGEGTSAQQAKHLKIKTIEAIPTLQCRAGPTPSRTTLPDNAGCPSALQTQLHTV